MDIKNKMLIKKILLLALIVAIPIAGNYTVDALKIPFLEEDEVEYSKFMMVQFARNHQNSESGLFIEPTIEACYYGVEDGQFNHSEYQNQIDELEAEGISYPAGFFVHYIFGKQNEYIDGGFSDMGGISNMESTYQVLQTIKDLDPEFFTREDQTDNDELTQFLEQNREDKVNAVAKFLRGTLGNNSYGFKQYYIPDQEITLSNPNFDGEWGFVPPDEESLDLISEYIDIPEIPSEYAILVAEQAEMSATFYGLALADEFAPTLYIDPNAMGTWLNSSWRIGGYGATNTSILPDLRSTYFGIQIFQKLGYEYSPTDKLFMQLYFDSLFRGDQGGYSSTPLPTDLADIQSTFYALKCMQLVGLTPSAYNQTQLLNFTLSCQNPDGGFGLYSYQHYLLQGLSNVSQVPIEQKSTFINGWAAMKILDYLNASSEAASQAYLEWKSSFQSKTGLYGYITVESQYYGVASIAEAYPTALADEKIINSAKVVQFIDNCSDLDGGYSSVPEIENSSLYSTFCAIKTYKLLEPYSGVSLPTNESTIAYLKALQNNDTDYGFKIDNASLSQFLFMIPQEFQEYQSLIPLLQTNISTALSTFWAVASLNALNGLSEVNTTAIKLFLQANQGADGGFSFIRAFHTDLISTYYSVLGLKELNADPSSVPALLEFVKGSQAETGAFTVNPLLKGYFDYNFYFQANMVAWIILELYNEKPEYLLEGLMFVVSCLDLTVYGIADYPGFGADLHNNILGVHIIDMAKEFPLIDPTPYHQFFNVIIGLEVFGFIMMVIFSIWNRMKASLLNTILKNTNKKAALTQYPAVDVQDATIYAGKKIIVNKVSMRLEHGDILGVLGESGAGKSTFVKGLLGMRKFTGTMRIYGFDSKREAKKIKPYFGYVPQDLSKIYDNFTVIENLITFGQQYGLETDEIVKRSKIILRSLQIADKEDELVSNLSGGQKRRVSIAIALVHEPVMCILDEPTSGLDPVVREDLWLSLTDLNERLGTTLIVITHYPEESRFCDKVAIFGRNKGMIDFGTPSDLLALLPGEGRAIEIVLGSYFENAAEKLRTIPEFEIVLERKIGEEFIIFCSEPLLKVASLIQTHLNGISIQIISQTEARMEDFFRFRFLEVVI